MSKKEKKRGHRQGQRDRDDSRSSGSAFASSGYTWGGTYSSPGSGLILSYPAVSTAVYGDLPEITEGKPTGLPTRDGDLPIMAWKAAQIVRGPKALQFAGIVYQNPYELVETAACKKSGGYFGSYSISYSFTSFGGAAISPTQSVEPAPDGHDAPHEHCHCGFYGVNEEPASLEQRYHVMLEVEFYGKVIVAEKGYRAEKQRVIGMHLPERCEFCTVPPVQFVIANGYGSEPETALRPRCAQHVGPFDVPFDLDQVSTELGIAFA